MSVSVTPEISPRRRSSGAATVAAITLGSAPGRLARDINGREFDGRQAGDREKQVGDRADEEQADRQQRCADRPPDERV